MKQLLISIVVASTLLISCSKKDVTPAIGSIVISTTTYPTIRIGTQTWTSVNYNGPGGLNYNNGPNVPLNGKLYTVSEADSVSLSHGWRVPTSDDYYKLIQYIGGSNANGTYQASGSMCYSLMSSASWNTGFGTNTSGFDAIATGYMIGSSSYENGIRASFITSSSGKVQGFLYPYSFDIYSSTSTTTVGVGLAVNDPVLRASLRFVKDN